MKYHSTDQRVQVGDVVRYFGEEGKIVFVIDDDSFSTPYPKEHWSYLGKGVGIEMQNGKWKGNLFVITTSETDEDLEPKA
jgi:hypothetical protein